MRRDLKVAIVTWATHAGQKALVPFLRKNAVDKLYFCPEQRGPAYLVDTVQILYGIEGNVHTQDPALENNPRD